MPSKPVQPAALKKNDLIAMIGPSGYLDPGKITDCLQTLQQWGYQVMVDPETVGVYRGNYFAGSDLERTEAMQRALDNPDVKAILCARGGYGMSRIIDQLDFKKFKKHPKWIIGFSDITLLHLHLNRRVKISSLHAPMAAAFMKSEDTSYLLYLQKALKGSLSQYKFSPQPDNNTGHVTGELIGGNLCLLAHSVGSPSEPDVKGKILFIEDVGEHFYTIDRFLWQLKRAGWMDKIAALLVGDFSTTKDTTQPFGKSMEQIIKDVIPQGLPVAFHIPVGHQPANITLKCGVQYDLNIGKKSVILKEK
ncbi:muramoyltetrapeptide carboxypeptidase [Arachidicoccus rhizosphaerae]|uniref:Muramoyltetrapeptide carboxypeptidase n=1 Tax=Arachidicoccus rhizosphaerae TaxID=551991 RepID=A0A1H4A458_9BACT|nr:LD-carboxypeptidase [Arachidicoccus rhizosphaerae]SEA30568.1 muramoyltetrapeptide carboxypeptidase [Arachidicoccus rhizosphaerae]